MPCKNVFYMLDFETYCVFSTEVIMRLATKHAARNQYALSIEAIRLYRNEDVSQL